MRILHLATFLQGGAGLVMTSLARQQRLDGHDVAVVTSKTGVPGYGNYPSHLDRLRDAGVRVHLVDSLFRRDPIANDRVRTFLLSDPELSRPVDVVHAHAAVPARLGLDLRLAGHVTGPVLQTMHGWGCAKTAEQERHDLQVMARLDGVVVPNRRSSELLTRLGLPASLVRVIPYGVEPHAGDASTGGDLTTWLDRADAGAPRARATICCVGTIGERKNQRLLVEALARIPGDLRPLCLFVGDGEGDGLLACARALGVEQWTHWLGLQADVRPCLRKSDWLVLPSRSEGLPLAVLEAFRDGVPVVLSDIPEHAEFVRHGDNGLLFGSDDPDALASTLCDALSMRPDVRRTLAAQAHDEYLRHYTVTAMTGRYAAEYARLTAARGACVA